MVLKYLRILVFNLCFCVIQPYVIGLKFICLNFSAAFVDEKFFHPPALYQQAAERKRFFVLFRFSPWLDGGLDDLLTNTQILR